MQKAPLLASLLWLLRLFLLYLPLLTHPSGKSENFVIRRSLRHGITLTLVVPNQNLKKSRALALRNAFTSRRFSVHCGFRNP
jgi:hypothetical protein